MKLEEEPRNENAAHSQNRLKSADYKNVIIIGLFVTEDGAMMILYLKDTRSLG
jgi:ribosomal protein S18